jgi:hypothetical protein
LSLLAKLLDLSTKTNKFCSIYLTYYFTRRATATTRAESPQKHVFLNHFIKLYFSYRQTVATTAARTKTFNPLIDVLLIFKGKPPQQQQKQQQ